MARSAVKTRTEVKKLLGNTRNLLEDIRTSRRETVGQLRKDLAQSRSGVKSDVKQMLKRFQKARLNSVAEFKVKTARQKPAAGRQVGSRAAKTPLKTKPKAAGEEIREEKMLSVVNKHPEGISLAGIAKKLGIAPVVLGRASKGLKDKGRIRKEGTIYFPANGKGKSGRGSHFRPPRR